MFYSRAIQHFPQLRHRLSSKSFAMRSLGVACGAGASTFKRLCTSLRQRFSGELDCVVIDGHGRAASLNKALLNVLTAAVVHHQMMVPQSCVGEPT
jgi:hypothetical protein